MNNMKKWNKLNYIQLINDNWISLIIFFSFPSFRIFVLKISSLRRESTESPGKWTIFAKLDGLPGRNSTHAREFAKNSKFPGTTPIHSRATITFWANSRATGYFSDDPVKKCYYFPDIRNLKKRHPIRSEGKNSPCLFFSSDEFCWRTNKKWENDLLLGHFPEILGKTLLIFIFVTFNLQYDSENDKIKRIINW